jgi:hypothetical protein
MALSILITATLILVAMVLGAAFFVYLMPIDAADYDNDTNSLNRNLCGTEHKE